MKESWTEVGQSVMSELVVMLAWQPLPTVDFLICTEVLAYLSTMMSCVYVK